MHLCSSWSRPVLPNLQAGRPIHPEQQRRSRGGGFSVIKSNIAFIALQGILYQILMHGDPQILCVNIFARR